MENALYDFIHSLRSIRKLTRSLRSLVRFLILLNSWIKIVRAHFPWSNLYFLEGGLRGQIQDHFSISVFPRILLIPEVQKKWNDALLVSNGSFRSLPWVKQQTTLLRATTLMKVNDQCIFRSSFKFVLEHVETRIYYSRSRLSTSKTLVWQCPQNQQ